MERKQLIVNSDNDNDTTYTWKQKISIAIFYLLLFVPIVLNFVYLLIFELNFIRIINIINQTKLMNYIEKTEKIIDYVCKNENIC